MDRNLTRFRSALAGPSFVAHAHPAPRPRVTMFQFRVHCAGDLKFDVQAASEDDAVAHVKKRHTKKIETVELIGQIKAAPIDLGSYGSVDKTAPAVKRGAN